jgi:hypothetical protein
MGDGGNPQALKLWLKATHSASALLQAEPVLDLVKRALRVIFAMDPPFGAIVWGDAKNCQVAVN